MIKQTNTKASNSKEKQIQNEKRLHQDIAGSSKCIINEQQRKNQVKQDEEKQQSCIMTPIRFLLDFFHIYSLGGCKDKVLMFFGVILALCAGVTFPLFMYFWGKQIDHTVNDYWVFSSTLDTSLRYYMAFIGLAVGSFLLDGVVFALWKVLSQRIAFQFRIKYLETFVKKPIEWIDRQNLYQTSAKFKLNCLTIQKATGDKVALFYNLNGAVVSGIIAAICVRWTFALFLLALIPVGMAALGYFIYVLIMRKIESKKFFQKADGQSIQAVSLIKTVKSLGAQKSQEQAYQKKLDEYQQKIKSYPLKMGIATGLFYFIQYLIFGVGFMFGIQCINGTSACPVSVTGSTYSVGDMHIVFFQVYFCTYFFLQIAANFDAIKDAIGSSKEIFSFIQETQNDLSRVENISKDSIKIEGIQFKNVVFSYPTNMSKIILRGVSFKPLTNKFNAIVGATGSGKSTIAQLLLKFYPPNEGQIFVDGKDITEIDPAVFLNKVGFVGQQPTLFCGSIRENVTVGKVDASDQEIWEVLRQVNLHDFVMRLPQQLNYDVGFGGQKLSGGQKQRIAIARTLIKKPQLLILDEATSALDRKSEKLIQKAFDSIFSSKNLNMTVICIAHRVKTIMKADRIFCMENGVIKEEGVFKELSCFKNLELFIDEQETEMKLEEEVSFPGVLQEKKEAVDQESFSGNIYSKLFEHTQHKCQYIISLVMSFLSGLNHPAAILIISYVYNQEIALVTSYLQPYGQCLSLSPSECQASINNHHDKAVKFLGGLIGFAFYAFIPYFVQFFLMTKLEEQIVHNLRKSVFSKLMLMPLSWYDRPENEGGQVASKFATDVKQASTLISTYIPTLITNFTTIIVGIAICLGYLWQVGFFSLFSIPLIAIGGYISMIFIGGYDDETIHRYDDSDKIATQIMVNIKTATSQNYQDRLLKKYSSLIDTNPIESIKRGAKIGFFFGFSIFIFQAAVGSQMFGHDNVLAHMGTQPLINRVVALTVPMWCGWVAGNSFFFVAHVSAGKKSAARVFQLLEEKTEAEIQQTKGTGILSPLPKEIKGRIEFKGVSFRYTPGGKYVLKDINLVIEARQKAAFVGESGCGKSSLMLLIQRFYDYQGVITLDGVNILNYDLAAYRSYFSVLSQEPSLFTCTVGQNIQFGGISDSDELREACKLTFAYDVNRAWKGEIPIDQNIDEFLNRDTGVKGSKVSGGEKQRIACARAVLKKPRIFIMDEGTSALDRETERRVQQNIDQKLKGITMVSIAHRLQTIENSDIIFMLEEGQIVQRGTYKAMMEKKQHFYKFVQGEAFKTIDQLVNLMLIKLVRKILGGKSTINK